MKRLLLLAFAAVAAAQEPEVLADEWQLVRMFGHDSGYVHLRAVKRGDLIETTTETNLVMKRMDAEIRIAVTETCEERASDGALVRLSSKRKMSEYETDVSVRFEGGKAFLTTTVAGQARETEKECGEGLLGLYRIEQLTRAAGRAPGTKVEAKSYMIDFGGPVTLDITVGGEEEVELLDGKKEKLTKVETAIRKFPLKPQTWIDAEGKARKTLVNVAGVAMESFATTEERAKKGGGPAPAPPPDVFYATLIAPLHPIPSPRRLDRATFRIRSKEEIKDLADGRQSVEKQDDGSLLLRIERKVPPAERPAVKPPAELASCLAANSMVQSDAPEIVAIASEAKGGDAWAKAQGLERWVHDNITKKSMDVGFASALEVCRNRQGDCTEHAVLLCALCRAAGIPSRVAMGIVCIGHAFGGHAWTEVWIDGDWYQLDGTLGLGSVDAAHITLGRMALEDNAGSEGFIGLLQGLNGLEIDPVELVVDGRPLRPAEDAARIEGDRFESRLHGIAFTRPEGFEFDPPGPNARMTARIMELDGKTASGKTCEIEIEVMDTVAWEALLDAVGRRFDSTEETKIDGRPAIRGVRKDSRVVLALADAGLFLFTLDRCEGEAELKAFEAFLASVDFDVK